VKIIVWVEMPRGTTDKRVVRIEESALAGLTETERAARVDQIGRETAADMVSSWWHEVKDDGTLF
jgi:hypothetical protein